MEKSQGSFDYQRMVVGYHGCDKEVLEQVLLKGMHLRKSKNRWDWLGQGTYFWEFGPQRALAFAKEQQKRGKIDEPTVLGAYINLSRCFDLTDVEHTHQLATAYPIWLETFEASQTSPPINTQGRGGNTDVLLRDRDCAVLNWYMNLLDTAHPGSYYYQTVRGVFVEGEPVYDGSGIYTKTHTQLAVRDPACVLGYFRPTFFFHEEEANDD